MKRMLFSLLITMLPFGDALAQAPADKAAKVTLVAEHELPNVPGKSLRAVLVEYQPGAGSPSHRHPASAFIYARVLEGAIRSKVNEAPERTYQVGESWTERPGDHHQVSQNASTTAPAKLLAVFVVDTSDRQISHSGQVARWPNCVRLCLCPLMNFVLDGTRLQWRPMRDHGETTVFHIRGTDPANSEQVVYACVGFPRAHAKAAELRMSGYKDVVTSMAPAGDQTASQTA